MSKQQRRPHKQHDHSYKKFFTHPQMVRDLLSGFVKPAWLSQLDHNSWEKVNGNFVTDDSRERIDDIIWKVRWGEQWIWIYIIIEFQATIDYSMPVRINGYTSPNKYWLKAPCRRFCPLCCITAKDAGTHHRIFNPCSSQGRRVWKNIDLK